MISKTHRVLSAGILSLGLCAGVQAAPIILAGASMDLFPASVDTTGTASFDLIGIDSYFGSVDNGSLQETTNAEANIFVGFGTDAFASSDGVEEDLVESEVNLSTYGSATAFTTQDLLFDVAGTGTVTLTFDYTISAEITDAISPAATALASVIVSESLTGEQDTNSLDFDSGNPNNSVISDVLTLTFNVTGTDSGTLSFEARAAATSVPAPTTLPLMLAALGVVGARTARRRA